MLKQVINGGTVNQTINYFEADDKTLEKDTRVPCSFRVSPEFAEYIEKRARSEGITRSKYIEKCLLKYFRSEKRIEELKNILSKIDR